MAPPKIRITGIRGSIPPGYFLGRTSVGYGDVELIGVKQAQAYGLIPSTLPPSGAAGGDLGGNYPDPDVIAIQGNPISAVAPTHLQSLMWVTSEWAPRYAVPQGGNMGQVLTKQSNADQDFDWEDGGSSGGGAPASIRDTGTDIELALQDADGQLILDGSGNPIFAPEVFPAASLPLGSASAFGAVKVDGTSIFATAGVLSGAAIASGSWTPTDGSGGGLTFSAASGSYTTITLGAITIYIISCSITYPVTADVNLTNIAGCPGVRADLAALTNNNAAAIIYAFFKGGTPTRLGLANAAGSMTNAAVSGKLFQFSFVKIG